MEMQFEIVFMLLEPVNISAMTYTYFNFTITTQCREGWITLPSYIATQVGYSIQLQPLLLSLKRFNEDTLAFLLIIFVLSIMSSWIYHQWSNILFSYGLIIILIIYYHLVRSLGELPNYSPRIWFLAHNCWIYLYIHYTTWDPSIIYVAYID